MCSSQTQIRGTIIQNDNSPILGANILLKDSTNSYVLNYSLSSENGTYELFTDNTGLFKLSFSSLGFKTQTFSFEIKKNQKVIYIRCAFRRKPYKFR
nr:carboxypeptidase-like regulatory domain-containing protein [Gelidibacter algens]